MGLLTCFIGLYFDKSGREEGLLSTNDGGVLIIFGGVVVDDVGVVDVDVDVGVLGVPLGIGPGDTERVFWQSKSCSGGDLRIGTEAAPKPTDTPLWFCFTGRVGVNDKSLGHCSDPLSPFGVNAIENDGVEGFAKSFCKYEECVSDSRVNSGKKT